MAAATAATCSFQGTLLLSANQKHRQIALISINDGWTRRANRKLLTKCSRTLGDFIGGDLIRPDLGRWLSDVEEHKAIAIYSPHEGGYEGRYLTRLKYNGYHFLSLSARGLGDPETTLTKLHPVCPPNLGKQPIARWYFPPEVDYRLSLLPPNAKGLVVAICFRCYLRRSCSFFLYFHHCGHKSGSSQNAATGENSCGNR